MNCYLEKPERAVIEYIWNGFDANASTVKIVYKFTEWEDGTSTGYPDLEIIDDGDGWNFEKKNKMEIFLASDKRPESTKSLPHGSKGVGRCTFYVFADEAKWKTVYDKKPFVFKIKSSKLDTYETVEEKVDFEKGTRIIFKVNRPGLKSGA